MVVLDFLLKTTLINFTNNNKQEFDTSSFAHLCEDNVVGSPEFYKHTLRNISLWIPWGICEMEIPISQKRTGLRFLEDDVDRAKFCYSEYK